MDDPPGRRKCWREHHLHGGGNHGPGMSQCQVREGRVCDADEIRGRGRPPDDSSIYEYPHLRLALPIREGDPSGGGPTPSGRLDRPEPDGVGSPNGGVGDHDTVRLRRVLDRVSVFEHLHLGVDGGIRGGPGGAHTGLVPIPDR